MTHPLPPFRKRVLTVFLKLSLIIVFCILAAACGKAGDAELAGTYEAVISGLKGAKKPVNVSMELRSDHKGQWTVEDDTAEFRWEIREGKIWIHTVSGGVIVGDMEKNGFRIRLPGAETGFFSRSRE